MLGFLKGIFSSGVMGSIERIATEAIETEKETAEAKALFVKTLDPNGIMRRELSRFASFAYGFYLVITVLLVISHSYGFGEPDNSQAAMEALTDLFGPITVSWTTIVGASFGVNGLNVFKSK
jgi:hypothetical protein